MMRSLRGRLLVLLTATVLAAWAATALFTYFDARREIDALLDAHLAQSAALLVVQAGGALPGPGAQAANDAHGPGPAAEATPAGEVPGVRAPGPDAVVDVDAGGRAVAFQLWQGDAMLLRSANAPLVPLGERGDGFGDSRIEGERWRVFGRRDAQGRLALVGERHELRQAFAQSVASHLLHPLAIALPALALLIWLAVDWGLRPLRRIAREVAGRAPDKLAPLHAADAPDEALPLLHGLNALFERVSASIEKERRFTADAAHELRTPLAAAKTQIQVADSATDPDLRRHALAQALAGIDRGTRLVEQLLVLARIDPGAAVPSRRPVRLDELAARCLADLAPAAAARGVDLALEGEAAGVTADPLLLEVLLRNLVDNAVRCTPAGGTVTVSTHGQASGATLAVEDTGPGIPAEALERATERFYRVPGSVGAGSGLGLSIVSRIARMHEATLQLAPGTGGVGLRAEVRFPPP